MRGVWLVVSFFAMGAMMLGCVFSESIKFGSDVDKKEITLGPGENGYFEFSLVNIGSSDLWVTLETHDSGTVITKAVPGGMSISVDGGEDVKKWYLLEDGVTHVPIYYARVYVEAPNTLDPKEFHDQTIKVKVKAMPDTGYSDEGIREKLAQEHDYELTVKMSDEFYSKLEAPDEEINLSFDKERSVAQTKKEETIIEESNQVEYINASGAKRLDVTKKISGNAIEAKENENVNDNGGTGTLAVIILCITAIGIAIMV